MGVVLGLIPRWGEGHGQTRAGVCLSSIGMAWVPEKQTRRWIWVEFNLGLKFSVCLGAYLHPCMWSSLDFTNALGSRCNLTEIIKFPVIDLK